MNRTKNIQLIQNRLIEEEKFRSYIIWNPSLLKRNYFTEYFLQTSEFFFEKRIFFNDDDVYFEGSNGDNGQYKPI